MKRMFLYVKDQNNKDKYNWVKCTLLQENDLTIDNIASIFNQHLINKYPTEVFFKSPNMLFYKINNNTYMNYGDDASIIKITSVPTDDYKRELIFSGYVIMKNYLFKLFFNNKEQGYDI